MQSYGKKCAITCIMISDMGFLEEESGHSITLILQDEVDVSRGDIISSAEAPAEEDQFEDNLAGMYENALLSGPPYFLKIGGYAIFVSVTAVKHQVNVNTLEYLAARLLALNAFDDCNLGLDRQLAFYPYAQNRDIGGFVLIDRQNNNTGESG